MEFMPDGKWVVLKMSGKGDVGPSEMETIIKHEGNVLLSHCFSNLVV